MIDVLPIVAAGILTAGAAYATARYYPLVEERLERAGVHPRAFVTRLTSTSEEKDDDEAIEFEAEELSETAAACLATLNAQVKTAFDEDNSDHVDLLKACWHHLQPSVPYPGRNTRDWGRLGFQGADPVTDLRGMGILGLKTLVRLKETDRGLGQSKGRLT
eukprot:m.107119 g.107119  ORF g.107119 m.107119 type:complete len:161 (-) comp15305_c0_seq5:38-520(-)